MSSNDIQKLVQPVDIENIYEHVLRLEGIRHPIVDPHKLNEAADYIADHFRAIGAEVGEQTFPLDGFDFPFRNVEGLIGGNESSELLITAHYDTVRNSPGADDNASAVAAVLEAARVLAESGTDRPIRAVCFTLEEGNPTIQKELIDHGRNIGILDERYRYTTHYAQEAVRAHSKNVARKIRSGEAVDDAWAMANDELADDTNNEVNEYLAKMRELSVPKGSLELIGLTRILGSSHWSEQARSAGKRLAGVINLETVGYTSTDPHSQRFPRGVDPARFLHHRLELEQDRGDFIAVVSDKRSTPLGQAFFDQCSDPAIDLPALFVAMPHEVGTIARQYPDMLRSDHAPFWRDEYPAIMLTDTADFRTPYYHSPGDTIEKLDFDFIKKVCQATVLTAIRFGG